jgi:hypothetical protein
MRIETIPGARDELTKLCERTGMKQLAVVSRVIEWLTKQSDVVQASVLGIYPEDLRSKVAEILLKDMAAKSKRNSES